MKDIMLKIIGKQMVGEETEEKLEFITEGKLYERNGSKYLRYEESEFSGYPGCTTTLKVTEEMVKMRRTDKENNFRGEMIFEKGKRMTNVYPTPYGDMDMELLTRDIVNSLSEDGYGTIDIDYRVSLNGMAEGRNQLCIEVMK